MRQHPLDQPREEALRRFRILAPLLDEGLAACERRHQRALALSQNGISERTLRRWLADYLQGGFDALVPKDRKDKGGCKAISPEALALAEQYRKELPRRSAERIQQLLAGDGHSVARSTLERHLRQKGYSGREILATQKHSASRRFHRVGRNTLWQSDIKYGPYLPDPRHSGKKVRTYLLVLLDDATRMVMHAEFYDNQKLPILEDALRKAILRCGVPKNLYVDYAEKNTMPRNLPLSLLTMLFPVDSSA